MDFSDTIWKSIQDVLPANPLQTMSSIVCQLPHRENTFQFRFRLAEHGITISEQDGPYNHFRPVFT